MSKRRAKGEGSIHQRPDGRWVATLDLGHDKATGRRRRKQLYARTQAEAVAKLKAAQLERSRHGDLPVAAPTVESWLRTWLDDIAPDRVRPTTMPSYRSKMERYVIPAVGRHRLDRLEPSHLRAMYRAMRQQDPPLAEATLRQTHQILSRALKVAVREGKVNRNVAELVDAPSTYTKKPDPPNPTEVAAILEAIIGDRLESRWLAALLLGMRQGEALGLSWGHVDLDAGTLSVDRALARLPGVGLVMVPPKSEASVRTVPLPEQMWASLRLRRQAYEAERAATNGSVAGRRTVAQYADLDLVWGQPNGRPTQPRSDWQAWTDLLARAQVAHRRLHDARHAAASTLAALGVPVDVRMQILGHSDVKMAMHYTHVDLAPMQAAMALLDQAHRAIEA